MFHLLFRLSRDLVITTGTYGLLEYPDKNGEPTPVYLSNDSGSYIPVPEYFWKVVHDPQTGTSAAFIGLNDPHTSTQPDTLCPNRSYQDSGRWQDELRIQVQRAELLDGR